MGELTERNCPPATETLLLPPSVSEPVELEIAAEALAVIPELTVNALAPVETV